MVLGDFPMENFINRLPGKAIMGRIKTKLIKRKTHELKAAHSEHFTTDFEQNKQITNKFTVLKSKKIRNIIAGYMTRLKRAEAK